MQPRAAFSHHRVGGVHPTATDLGTQGGRGPGADACVMTKRWVLYVAHDASRPDALCPGSRACLNALGALRDECAVQVVDRMLENALPLPEWLDGTPILVDTESRQALKGSDAYEYLASQPEADDEEPAAPAPQPPLGRPVGDRVEAARPAAGRAPRTEGPGLEGPGLEGGGASDGGNTDFGMLVDGPVEPPVGKITDGDLERYMERRKQTGGQPG